MDDPILALLFVCACLIPIAPAVANEAWPTVLGDAGGMRYSSLRDIHARNVARLQVAWTYRHGDYRSGWPVADLQGTVFEATPVLAGDRLVFSTPFGRVIALDPGTGRELWAFDPKLDKSRYFPNKMVSRGVAQWRDGSDDGACSHRIFLATLDARLIALDAATGRPCAGFGQDGTVRLLEGIEGLADPWEYNLTSPPAVIGDRVVVGSSVADMIRRVQPSGAVRAFDARTGRLVWQFHTIPRTGEPGAETWGQGSNRTHGGANVWSVMTVDPGRGWVFLPVSTAGPDHYGGDRPGDNLFSDAVVAVDGRTGERRWHYQTVHHDLWDYDLAAPPILATIRRGGRAVDAVIQLTKHGFVFVLDRETGLPLFPVEERPVPASDVPGEAAARTQPFPVAPAPLLPLEMRESDLWRADHRRWEACRSLFSSLRHEGIFTPPSVRGTLMYPSAAGGVNWFGGAFDPQSNVLVVPVNNVALVSYLDPLPPENYEAPGGVVLHSPVRALHWLLRGTGTGLRYHMIRRSYFARNGVFCNAPPWSKLVALDMSSGEVLWSVPLGETAAGVAGALSFAPVLATAGGIVFASGAEDRLLRAFGLRDGQLLARFPLPAGLHAGAMTYRWRGRQYLLVAPGGHATMPTPLGDWIVAMALPASHERANNNRPHIPSGHRRDVVTQHRARADCPSLLAACGDNRPIAPVSAAGRQGDRARPRGVAHALGTSALRQSAVRPPVQPGSRIDSRAGAEAQPVRRHHGSALLR